MHLRIYLLERLGVYEESSHLRWYLWQVSKKGMVFSVQLALGFYIRTEV